MLPKDKNLAYLWDMLDVARTAYSFIKDIKFHQYEKDRKLQLAVERTIEIIGEAARKVTKDFQDRHSEILWKGIIGQRHIIAHDYGDIKHERMWLVITERIPELIKLLEPLIPSDTNYQDK